MIAGANPVFQHSAQTQLGKRTNCLLVKDDVGRAKPATRNLPGNHFAFGKQTQFNESAGEGKCPSRHP